MLFSPHLEWPPAPNPFRPASRFFATHPDYQGRGLAKQLMLKLIHRQLARRETPFLHVMSANTSARALYERMGFRNYKESVVRVVSRD